MESLKDLLFIILLSTPFFTGILFVYLYKIHKHSKELLKEIEALRMSMQKDKNTILELNEEIKNQQDYFVQILTHELKVPTLAQLRGLEVLKDEVYGNLNEDQQSMIEQVQESCKYILDMISMVLKTYRLESNLNKLMYEKFNMPDLVLESFKENADLTSEKGIEFELLSSGKDIIVEADKNEIKRVLGNLLSSAVIYSNKSEKISVKINSDEDSLSLSIESSGIALSSKECSTIFERFSSKNPKLTAVGQGISLYLCKKIIDMHNGKIFVLTDEVKKNTFNFIIPLRPNSLNLDHISFLHI